MSLNIRHSILAAPAAPPPTAGLSVPPPTAGVLVGVTRTAYTGPSTITTNGTTVSNKNIGTPTGNAIIVNAANVTFSNCFILSGDYFAIDGDHANCTNLTVDHCTIDGGSIAGNAPILTCANTWTITNCRLTGFDNGIQFQGSNGLIEGNYIYALGASVWAVSTTYIVGSQVIDTTTSAFWRCLVAHTSRATGTFAQDRAAHPTWWGSVDPHVDGIQTGGCGPNIMIRGNWVESYDTSDIILKSDGGAINGVTITGNTLMHDPLRGVVANTVYALVNIAPVSNITVTNNRMSPGYTGSYIDRAGATGFTSSGNVDYNTGAPIVL